MHFPRLIRGRWLVLPVAFALVVAACQPGATTPGPGTPGPTPAGTPDATGPVEGGTVTVIGTWGGDEQDAFLAMVAPFEQRTGIDVQYTGTRDINTVLTTGVASGILPDLAGLPGPGQMQQWARDGALVDLSTVLDVGQYESTTAPAFVELGTVDGKIAGVFIKSAIKGLIWYNPNHVTDIPGSWSDVESMAASPSPAGAGWCIGIESGAASGWPGTDWIENILIRQAGPDVYDAWWQGDHPWTSPEVRQAFETYGQAVQNAHGGATAVVSTNFGDAGQPLFTDPPGCLFHHQASFITGFFAEFPQSPQPGTDYDFFVMPDMNDQYAGAVTGAGDLFGMFNDTPQARALMQYLVTAEAQQIWVDRGGALSGNLEVTTYPDDVSSASAAALREANIFRFDGSDLMPEAMNAAFWQAMVDYTQNPGQLDAILERLDGVRTDPATYGGQ
ncbi:MAG TPA: extracellular solute-binding protein [Candidatus Limnocylindrales bacterium]|jgi:alpha-glucoside transport system substrate-binding protein|nr:extracellular solute-binding protein [Candidatus Limnocylindrales bacterium]